MYFNQVEMVIRLILAALLGGIIGYEREVSGRNAGVRTHAIVSLGAAIITLIQLGVSAWVLDFVVQNPEYHGAISTDVTRMTAQIISGIGFLGAGTIIVSRRSVTGLTTAATIWTVAGLGVAVGFGNYLLGIVGTIIVLVVLRTVKGLFRMDKDKGVEIQYLKGARTIKYLENLFEEHEIKIISEDYSVTYSEDGESLHTVIYALHVPTEIRLIDLIDLIGSDKNILKITTLKWN